MATLCSKTSARKLLRRGELEQPQCEATKESLQNVLDKVVKNGQCESVQQVIVPNYLEECQGILCIMKKVKKEAKHQQ